MTKKALIVDDEEDIGKLMTHFLEKEQIDTQHVSRVKNAVQIIEQGDHSLFFLDINLPDGSGYDLVPLIRESVPNPYIVMISAREEEEEKSRLKASKVNAFVKKPFSKKQIMNSIPG